MGLRGLNNLMSYALKDIFFLAREQPSVNLFSALRTSCVVPAKVFPI